jgi:hypothetical protein
MNVAVILPQDNIVLYGHRNLQNLLQVMVLEMLLQHSYNLCEHHMSIVVWTQGASHMTVTACLLAEH